MHRGHFPRHLKVTLSIVPFVLWVPTSLRRTLHSVFAQGVSILYAVLNMQHFSNDEIGANSSLQFVWSVVSDLSWMISLSALFPGLGDQSLKFARWFAVCCKNVRESSNYDSRLAVVRRVHTGFLHVAMLLHVELRPLRSVSRAHVALVARA